MNHGTFSYTFTYRWFMWPYFKCYHIIFGYIYIYVCVCMCMYVSMYVCTCTCRCTYIYIHIHIHICCWVVTHKHVYIYICVCVCVCVFVCVIYPCKWRWTFNFDFWGIMSMYIISDINCFVLICFSLQRKCLKRFCKSLPRFIMGFLDVSTSSFL